MQIFGLFALYKRAPATVMADDVDETTTKNCFANEKQSLRSEQNGDFRYVLRAE